MKTPQPTTTLQSPGSKTFSPQERIILEKFLQKHPSYQTLLPEFSRTFATLVAGFQTGQRLFLCGNGGSFSDCLHISGELMKSFKCTRSLSPSDQKAFEGLEFGDQLAAYLEYGLPCVVLGLNHSLTSAIQNDNTAGGIHYAQELYALGRPNDMLLAISTSGNALNVRYAISVAKALGMKTIGLTGDGGGQLAQLVDVAIHAEGTSTERIQEHHIAIYHALCAMLEARFFQKPCHSCEGRNR